MEVVLPPSGVTVTLSVAQARQYAANAGFTGNALTTIVAIAQAESSLNPQAVHVDAPGLGEDRGLVQINSVFHPEVSAQCAFDPQCAMHAAYAISKSGTDFSPWATYNSGAYKRYLASSGGSPISFPVHVTPPAQLWPWLHIGVGGLPNDISQHFGQNGENGIDIALPLHTTITSLTNGTVLDTGWYGGGGVVSVQSGGIPGLGTASVYYQHLDEIDVVPGATVSIGERIGLSGGQKTGGFHPVTCCSTGPHVEVGLNCPTGTNSIWRPLGPNVDPLPWLTGLMQGKGSVLTQPGTPGAAIQNSLQSEELALVIGKSNGPVADSFASIFAHLDAAMEIVTWDEVAAQQSGGNWLSQLTGLDNLKVFGIFFSFLSQNAEAFTLRLCFVLLGLAIWFAFLFTLVMSQAEKLAPVAAEAMVGA